MDPRSSASSLSNYFWVNGISFRSKFDRVSHGVTEPRLNASLLSIFGPSFKVRDDMEEQRKLTDRKLDMLYVGFFIMHIPATLLLDLQTLYASNLRPTWLHNLFESYLESYNDPIICGAVGRWEPLNPTSWLWIRSFLWMEALFQLPLFFLGIYHLSKGSYLSCFAEYCENDKTFVNR